MKKRTTVHWNTETFKEKVHEVYDGKYQVIGEYTGINSRIKCKCHKHDIEWEPISSVLSAGKAYCPECKKEHSLILKEQRTNNFTKRINDKFPTIQFMENFTDRNTPIKVKCTVCNREWIANPNNLVRYGCTVCSNNKLLVGYNDIATTHSDLVRYFNDPTDAKKYTCGSNKKVLFKCPDCGKIQEKSINDFFSRGFRCKYCSDNISYQNKFCRKFLEFLPLRNLQIEYNPDWVKPYYYDNYFEYNGKAYILEADGSFHYENRIDTTELKKTKERDAIKDKLAKEHNVIMIRIDCRQSKMEYIKANIESSILADLFDLSVVNWNECDAYGKKNIAKEICNYLNSHPSLSSHELSDIFHLCNATILSYLRIGTKCGWCTYNNDIARRNSKKENKKFYAYGVKVYDKEGELLYQFNSPALCAKYLSDWLNKNFNAGHIGQVCNGNRSSHCGFFYCKCNYDETFQDYLIFNDKYERRNL